MKPRLLDLFCGAGGAGMGYYRAGFEIVGVDIRPQPRYPFAFIQGDALEYAATHGHEFDAIHASPPCQAYSVTKSIHGRRYPDMVASTRGLLERIGKPWVIENVMGAPLVNPLMLCGTMFNLRVIRHRLFEANPPAYFAPATCCHLYRTGRRGQYDKGQGGFITVAGHNFSKQYAALAMGIDWMTTGELAEAIPPAYTEFIGRHLLKAVLP